MATSRASLIRRHFRQRFGISASKVGIRSEVHWYWRALIWVAVFSVSFAASAWIYDAGRRIAGYDQGESERELSDMRDVSERLSMEEIRLKGLVSALDGRLQVELATVEQMGLQLRQLQRENASLKGELALFEALVVAPPEASDTLKIARVKIDPAAVAGRYRFSVLLVRQLKNKNAKDSAGELQFHLKIRRAGADAMIVVPGEGNPPASQFRVSVRHFHRAEGEFNFPEGASLQGGEVRVVQDGAVTVRHPIVQ